MYYSHRGIRRSRNAFIIIIIKIFRMCEDVAVAVGLRVFVDHFYIHGGGIGLGGVC